MKYWTRELYDSMQGLQPETPEDEAATARWHSVMAGYASHLDSIRSRLPESMQRFCETSLHDGVIVSAEKPALTTVVLVIDATSNPWGPRGEFEVVFKGVRQVSKLVNLVGDWWLYEEVHLDPDAAFDFRVLLSRQEFRVVADEVELGHV